MAISGMVRLVKDEETNVAAKVDVAVSECVEEDIGRRDDDAVFVKDTAPERGVFPLVWLVCARDEPDGDRKALGDDGLLLLRKRDGRHKEPRDLRRAIA